VVLENHSAAKAGNTMTRKLGDWLRDIRNPNLSTARLNDVVREADEFYDKTTKTQSWTAFTDSNPYFDVVHANQIDSLISPINGYSFSNSAGQSVPNITYTQLTFNNYAENTPIFQRTTENGKFKIAPNFHLFGCIGAMQWDASGVGERKLYAYVYDINDTLLYSQELHALQPYSADVCILPFANVMWIQPFKNLTYIRFWMWQNTGGATNMTHSRIGVFSFY
jgi:hypothetical protein